MSLFADPNGPRRLLLVKLSSLGDVVCTLPLLESLRSGLGPDIEIGWAVRGKFADILRGNPHISTVYQLQERGLRAASAFGGELRRTGPWDVAMDAQGLLLSGVVTRFSGAPVRIGWDRNREGNRFFLTHPVVPGRPREHIVDKLLQFCDVLGVPRLLPRRQDYLADGELERAEILLDGANRRGPCVGLIIGTSRADKAWPEERWTQAARLLAAEGMSVVLIGGPGEAAMAARIVEGSGGAVARNLTGQTTPHELASVLVRCGVVIGGDSGPTHLAVAVGTPVVGLYGVTDPALSGPQWGVGPSVVLDYAQKDAPQESRRSRHTTLTDALARIPAAAAAKAAQELLRGAVC